jgi:hypothetical protein
MEEKKKPTSAMKAIFPFIVAVQNFEHKNPEKLIRICEKTLEGFDHFTNLSAKNRRKLNDYLTEHGYEGLEPGIKLE